MDKPTSQPFWRSAILQFDMSDRSLLDIELITLELQRTLQDAINGRRRVRQIGRRGGRQSQSFQDRSHVQILSRSAVA